MEDNTNNCNGCFKRKSCDRIFYIGNRESGYCNQEEMEEIVEMVD